jgi:hypothetical protein
MDEADNTHVLLTLIAIETDLSLSGSRGQSPLQADFYARNFKQASFNLVMQGRSQYEVGRVAEFVHKAQRNAVSRGSLMKLMIPGGGIKHTAATNGNGMRGVRQGLSMSGYVGSMPRVHKKHDPAPQYAFDFVVSKMHTGIFEDQPYKAYKLATWSEIVDKVLEGNFIGPPMTAAEEDLIRASSRTGLGDIAFLGDIFGNGE